jgi:hypothetical protein
MLQMSFCVIICAVGIVHRMREMSTDMLTQSNAVFDINSHSRNRHSIAGKARKQSEGYFQGFESPSPKQMVVNDYSSDIADLRQCSGIKEHQAADAFAYSQ